MKEKAPSSAAAMDKLLTKNLREKFLAIGEVKELEKTRKAGDKVEKKKEVVMSDVVKSSLLYLEEDVQDCRERLSRVMAVPAEAAQIIATELSFRELVWEHMPTVSLAFTFATLRRYVTAETGWRKCSHQVELRDQPGV